MLSAMEQKFVHLFTCVSGFRRGLLSELDATDVSMLLHTYNLELWDSERSIHLNPLRDLPEVAQVNKAAKSVGYRVLLVGTDTHNLVQRISDPINYRLAHPHGGLLTFWMIIIQNHRRTVARDIVILNCLSQLETKSVVPASFGGQIGARPYRDDRMYDDKFGPVMTLMFSGPRPYRVVVDPPIIPYTFYWENPDWCSTDWLTDCAETIVREWECNVTVVHSAPDCPVIEHGCDPFGHLHRPRPNCLARFTPVWKGDVKRSAIEWDGHKTATTGIINLDTDPSVVRTLMTSILVSSLDNNLCWCAFNDLMYSWWSFRFTFYQWTGTSPSD